MSLYPTPSRIRLLAAVAARDVTGQARTWLLDGNRRVTASIREMQDAGWVEAGDPPGAADRVGIVTAHLIPAGRAVLSAAGRCGSCGSQLSVVGGHPEPATVTTVCGCVAGHCRSTPACASWGICGPCLLGGAA